LLKQRKAAVFKRYPFTIILLSAEASSQVQPFRIKLDPGSRTTGIAIVDDQSGQVLNLHMDFAQVTWYALLFQITFTMQELTWEDCQQRKKEGLLSRPREAKLLMLERSIAACSNELTVMGTRSNIGLGRLSFLPQSEGMRVPRTDFYGNACP
jgi:hypothetical protein